METLAKVCRADEGLLLATPYRVVDVTDTEAVAAGIAWWEELTAAGGEGMVAKPLDYIPARGGKRPIQPAIKCRGSEYLRIIYGPEYTLPEHLERLHQRGLTGKAASLIASSRLGSRASSASSAASPFATSTSAPSASSPSRANRATRACDAGRRRYQDSVEQSPLR